VVTGKKKKEGHLEQEGGNPKKEEQFHSKGFKKIFVDF